MIHSLKTRSRLTLAGIGPSVLLAFAGCARDTAAPTTAGHWQAMMEEQNPSNAPPLRQTPYIRSATRSNQITSGLEPTLRPSGISPVSECGECHPNHTAGFLQTAHHQSGQWVTQQTELPPTQQISQHDGRRNFEVKSVHDRQVHQLTTLDRTGELFAVESSVVDFEMGSGIHAHSYLAVRDGFHLQSPLTWYSAVDQWQLSPGYDPNAAPMFDRSITTRCVYCHTGQIQQFGDSIHRFEIKHASITCDRCHGASANHVKVQRNLSDSQSNTSNEQAEDLAIIRPSTLSRQAKEDLCNQCHLQGIAFAGSPGFEMWDFQPGEHLAQHITQYQIHGNGGGMRIVGHAEQLHRSQCYNDSQTLTCVDCHNPHQPTAGPIEQREHCLQCHSENACGVTAETRRQTQQDLCQVCHVPKRDTNVTHAALHDHEIGIHERSYELAGLSIDADQISSEQSKSASNPQLRAITSTESLPPRETKRRHALALVSLWLRDAMPSSLRLQLPEAQNDLIELYREDPSDQTLRITLAKLYLRSDRTREAEELARPVLERSHATSPLAVDAHAVLARVALKREDNATALEHYRQLVDWRFVAGDHAMLGMCEANAGNLRNGISSLEYSLRINPSLKLAHQLLTRLRQRAGDMERASAHRRALRQIEELEWSVE